MTAVRADHQQRDVHEFGMISLVDTLVPDRLSGASTFPIYERLKPQKPVKLMLTTCLCDRLFDNACVTSGRHF
jgi:hypothetical protein